MYFSSLLKFIRIVLSKGRKGRDGEIAATQVEVIPTTNMVSICRCVGIVSSSLTVQESQTREEKFSCCLKYVIRFKFNNVF